jgi:hypothetical protein
LLLPANTKPRAESAVAVCGLAIIGCMCRLDQIGRPYASGQQECVVRPQIR